MTQLTDTRHVTAFMGSAKLGASLRRHSYSAVAQALCSYTVFISKPDDVGSLLMGEGLRGGYV